MPFLTGCVNQAVDRFVHLPGVISMATTLVMVRNSVHGLELTARGVSAPAVQWVVSAGPSQRGKQA